MNLGKRAAHLIEALERRLVLSTVTWTGSAGDNLWTTQGNWNTNLVPGSADNVVISVPATTTITIPSGTQSINSLSCTASLSLTGGELAFAAASSVSGSMSITGGTLLANGTSATLQINGTSAVSNAALEAEYGGQLQFTQTSVLTSDNLTASGGGQLLFPAATSFASSANTVQASGTGSRINLATLSTFTNASGFPTQVTASTGSEIDVAGQASGVQLTLADAASTLNVAGISMLSNSGVSVTGGTLNFTDLTSVTDDNLAASGGGQALFPNATSIGSSTNLRTIQASGTGSRINLSALTTFNPGHLPTQITASTGGEIDVSGQLSSTNLTLSDGASTLNVAGVSKLSNLSISATGGALNFAGAASLTNVNVAASSGGRVLFPAASGYSSSANTVQASGTGSRINLSDLSTVTDSNGSPTQMTASAGAEIDLAGQISGANLTLSDASSSLNVATVTALSNLAASVAGGTLNFPAVASLTNVNVAASVGGQALFPAATSYGGSSNTVQASGTGSKINLSALNTFNSGDQTTQVTASTGGEIDLAGQLSNTSLTLSDTASTLNVAGVTKLSYLSVSATGGSPNFAAVASLTNVNLTAASGAQLLFPEATTYSNSANTIQASGTGSKIGLSALNTFSNGNASPTQVTASTGGEIDLAGQISGSNDLTLSNAGSTLSLAGVSSISNSTLTAAAGATWTFPAGGTLTFGSGDTLTTTGTGSGFINQGTLAVSGASLSVNTSAFTNTGVLDPTSSGTIKFSGDLHVNGSGTITGDASSAVDLAGSLLGTTTNAAQFAPLAAVNFDGTGTASSPQLLEAMSQDLGSVSSGFTNNFAYNSITLSNNTYVQLVDQSVNAAAAGAEAVYVQSLVVPAGCTLNLNALHLYAHSAQIGGTIVGVPMSTVAALPATEASPSFTVSWSGYDGPAGAGVASYSVYVSDDGGAYTPLVLNTTATSTAFTGAPGNTYGFYSIATDHAGKVQPTPTAAQATTSVATGLPTGVTASSGAAYTYNTTTDTLSLTSGTLTFSQDLGASFGLILTASGAGSSIVFQTCQHLAGLTLTGGATATVQSLGAARTHSNHHVLVIGELGAQADPTFSIDSAHGSKLDMTDNDLIIHTGANDATGQTELSAVQSLAATGRNIAPGGVFDGTWNGNGLTSSAAASIDASQGYEQNVLAVEGLSDMFLGSPTTDAQGHPIWQVGAFTENLGPSDIIVKFTYNGDLALDGEVDGNAATVFSSYFDNGATVQNDYAFGDLNGDGYINGNDATVFSSFYDNGMPVSGLPQL